MIDAAWIRNLHNLQSDVEEFYLAISVLPPALRQSGHDCHDCDFFDEEFWDCED